MNKAYFLAIFMLGASFVGCLDEEENDDGPKNAIYDLIDNLNSGNYVELCKMSVFELEDNLITLGGETELKACMEYWEEETFEWNITGSNYKEVKMNETLASNSGTIYEVTMDLEICLKFDNESWSCDPAEEDISYYAKVSGQWIDVSGEWEAFTTELIATFMVTQDSGGWYHVDVIKVSKQENLEDFSYYLKDTNGSTYTGGNGFGEIAMQMIGSHGGEEYGIDTSYDGDNQQLRNRASNVSNDDGSNFPVHFSDNDRDGKLSAGDQFLVATMGNSASGPAKDGWKLEIQYDITGDIIGSAKLL